MTSAPTVSFFILLLQLKAVDKMLPKVRMLKICLLQGKGRSFIVSVAPSGFSIFLPVVLALKRSFYGEKQGEDIALLEGRCSWQLIKKLLTEFQVRLTSFSASREIQCKAFKDSHTFVSLHRLHSRVEGQTSRW